MALQPSTLSLEYRYVSVDMSVLYTNGLGWLCLIGGVTIGMNGLDM